MSVPSNILQQVITYQKSQLAFFQNYCPFVSTANNKFKNFQDLTANRGDTVSFDLPPRFTSVNSLVASFQASEQRVHNLTVDQERSVSIAFTAQQFIFEVEDYMDKFGRGMTIELGTQIESNVAGNAETAPYRFYGDGVTPINSSLQLASALSLFRTVGVPRMDTMGYLQDTMIDPIINTNANQFTPIRNDDEVNSWELGSFSACDWYKSNLLPIHTAGSEGINASTLTVVSTVKNSDDAVTSIVFSGTNGASDADSVKNYDNFQFSDGVSGQPDMRFLTEVGKIATSAPVQFRATADAASTGGSQVTVTLYPPLKASAGREQNINNEIVAGMQATVLPTHRCALITCNNPLYVAMPRLPDESPYSTGNAVDEETGVSVRLYYGNKFGENVRGLVHDAIWGSTLVPEYSMKIALAP